MYWGKYILILCASLIVSACAGPKPIEEYTLARTALESARINGSPSFAPGYWHKAEEHYRKGVSLFRENANIEARKHFVRARVNAEKAENITVLKKFEQGEVQ